MSSEGDQLPACVGEEEDVEIWGISKVNKTLGMTEGVGRDHSDTFSSA